MDSIFVATVTVPSFGSTLHKDYLDALFGRGKGLLVEEAPNKIRIPWDRRTRQIIYEFHDNGSRLSFIKAIEKLLNTDSFQYVLSERPKYKDVWERYEDYLLQMDWSYAFSDDHRYWASGQWMMDELRKMQVGLGKDPDSTQKVKELWDKYCPTS